VTVRTWITISVIAAAALGGAFAVRLFRPIEAPALVARAGEVRLPAIDRGSCWPQGDTTPRCRPPAATGPGQGPRLDAQGRIDVFAAYPVQPEDGEIKIVDTASSRPLKTLEYTDRVDYDLPPGRYVLEVEGRYGEDAYVRYAFGFRV
jgi:hypothetical protein